MKRRREKTRPSSSSRATQWSLIEQRNCSKCETASSRKDRNNIPGNPTGSERSNQFLRNLQDLYLNPTSAKAKTRTCSRRRLPTAISQNGAQEPRSQFSPSSSESPC